MKVAVVGSGIAGLAAAHRLRQDAQVTLFEAGAWFAGHTHTVDVTPARCEGQVGSARRLRLPTMNTTTASSLALPGAARQALGLLDRLGHGSLSVHFPDSSMRRFGTSH